MKMDRRLLPQAMLIVILLAVAGIHVFQLLGPLGRNFQGWGVVAEEDALEGVADDPEQAHMAEACEVLVPLHAVKGQPNPGDWLAQHKEPGQTFAQYLAIDPVKPDKKRGTIYVSLLGEFDKKRKEVIDLTVEYMRLYFNVPVKFHDSIPLARIPDRARRVHPSWGMKQILSTYVLDHVLRPKLPKDALAYIAFTSSDLWPGKGWNFVFGQASIRARVGVWSIYRDGDPNKSDKAFRLCLSRTMKTGTHETGHMLSMLHCIAYECNMNGSNHRGESDSNPLYLGPVCLRKLCYAVKADPLERYRKLKAFCAKQKLAKAEAFFGQSIRKLEELDWYEEKGDEASETPEKPDSEDKEERKEAEKPSETP